MGQKSDPQTPVVVVDAVCVVAVDETDTTCHDDNDMPQREHQQQQQLPAQQQLVYGHLGRYNCPLQCPFCDRMVSTRTRNRIDGITILFVVLLLILFWPLFWLPFCMPKCKAVHHYCPQCHNKVGVTDPCN